MNARWQDWLRALAAEMAEGAVDSFVIVCGGSTVAATVPTALPANTSLDALATSIALGAAWYGVAWMKTHPFPFVVSSETKSPTPITSGYAWTIPAPAEQPPPAASPRQ